MITEQKTIHFDLSNEINNLKCEIDFIIKHNEIFSKNTIKTEIAQLLTKYEHQNDIHEHQKRKIKSID